MSKWNATLRRGVLALALAIFAVCQATAQQSINITISRIAGTVEVQNASVTKGQWVAAKKDQVIGAGWSLRTGATSKVQLVFPKDNIVILKENSVLSVDKLDEGGGAVVNAKSGGLLADIRNALSPGSEFDVKTPNALAVVRGTKFGVQITPQKSSAGGGGAHVSVNFMSGGRPMPVLETNTSFAVLLGGGHAVKADVDGDGTEEVVLPGTTAAKLMPAIQKIRNAAAHAKPGGRMALVNITEGDVNGDGKADLTVSLPRGGGQQDAAGLPEVDDEVLLNVGDLDGDGLPDYVVQGGMDVAHQLEELALTGKIKEYNPAQSQTQQTPRNRAAGASGDTGDATNVSISDSDDNDPKRHHPTQADPFPDPPNAVVTGDLDGDGQPDILVSGRSSLVNMFTKAGNQVNSASNRGGQAVHDQYKGFKVATGDVNGDGKPDAHITFTPPAGGDPIDVTLLGVGDVDGDGTPDYILQGGQSNSGQLNALIGLLLPAVQKADSGDGLTDKQKNVRDDVGILRDSPLEPGNIGSASDVVSPRDPQSGLPTGKRMHKPITITAEAGQPDGLVSGKPLQDWIDSSLSTKYLRKSGEIQAADFKRDIRFTRHFQAALLTQADQNGDGQTDLVILFGTGLGRTDTTGVDAKNIGSASSGAGAGKVTFNEFTLFAVPDADGDGVGDYVVKGGAPTAAQFQNLIDSSLNFVDDGGTAGADTGDGQNTDKTADKRSYTAGKFALDLDRMSGQDVNGDGKPDVVVSGGQLPDALRKSGAIHAADFNRSSSGGGGGAGKSNDGWSIRVAADDINGDGKADLTLNFTPGTDAASRKANTKLTDLVLIAVGDLDGDGSVDYLLPGGAAEGQQLNALIGLLLPAVQTVDDASTDVTVRGWDPKTKQPIVGTSSAGAATGQDIITGAGAGGGPHVQRNGNGAGGGPHVQRGDLVIGGDKIDPVLAAGKTMPIKWAAPESLSHRSAGGNNEGDGSVRVATGDVNGDGIADVTLSLDYVNNGGVVVVLDGVGDVDGDGHLDYVPAGGNSDGPKIDAILIGLLMPSVQGSTHPKGSGKRETGGGNSGLNTTGGDISMGQGSAIVAGADVDGDGKPDVVISGKDVEAMRKAGGDPHLSGGIRVSAADVNGDGKADLTFTFTPSATGQTTPAEGRKGLNAVNVKLASIGDVDGDGTPDFMLMGGASSQGDLNLLIGLLLPAVQTANKDYTTDPYVEDSQRHADVNGDGQPDVVVSGQRAEELRKAGEAAGHGGSGFTGGVRVATGDVNGDGKADLTINFTPSAADSKKGLNAVNVKLARIADVNGDGTPDFMLVGGASNEGSLNALIGLLLPAVHKIDDGGTSERDIITPAGSGAGPHVKVVDSDIITAAGAGGGPHVKRGDAVISGRDLDLLRKAGGDPITWLSPASMAKYSAGGGGGAGKAPAADGSVRVAAGDVNGDGIEDVTLNFTRKAGGGSSFKLLGVGDIDQDGLPDFVLGAGGSADQLNAILIGLLLPAVQKIDDTGGSSDRDIITGAGAGGGPHVKRGDGSVFSGAEIKRYFEDGDIPSQNDLSNSSHGSGGGGGAGKSRSFTVDLTPPDVTARGGPRQTVSYTWTIDSSTPDTRAAGGGGGAGGMTINFARSDEGGQHKVQLVRGDDLDGDGVPDFTVASGDSNDFGILIGLLRNAGSATGGAGAGKVSTPRDIASGQASGKSQAGGGGGAGSGPAGIAIDEGGTPKVHHKPGIAVGDVDGDGADDTAVPIGDVDQDGLTDYVLELSTTTNGKQPRGGGIRFVDKGGAVNIGDKQLTAVPAGDLDGDGRPDIVVLSSFNSGGGDSDQRKNHDIAMNAIRNIKARLAGGGDNGNGAGGIAIDEGGSPKVHHKPGLALGGDVNGDGKPDFVISGEEVQSFTVSNTGQATTGTLRVAKGDVNGDGVADVTLNFTRKGSDGALLPAVQYLLLGTGDVDGDGVPDFYTDSQKDADSINALIGLLLPAVQKIDDTGGSSDRVTGAGMGMGPHVKRGDVVVSGKTLQLLVHATDAAGNTGGADRSSGGGGGAGGQASRQDQFAKATGIRVAKGDVNGDGIDDVTLNFTLPTPGQTEPPATGGFDGPAFNITLSGVGDVDGDGTPDFSGSPKDVDNVSILIGLLLPSVPKPSQEPGGRRDIITGAGAGGGPHVKVVDSDIITAAGAGGGPHVKRGDAIISGRDLDPVRKAGEAGPISWLSPGSMAQHGTGGGGGAGKAPAADGSVRVAAGDVNGDGIEDVTLNFTRKAGGGSSFQLLGVGDIDQDGMPDFVLGGGGSADALNAILIGLLLPAVQTGDGQLLPAVQMGDGSVFNGKEIKRYFEDGDIPNQDQKSAGGGGGAGKTRTWTVDTTPPDVTAKNGPRQTVSYTWTVDASGPDVMTTIGSATGGAGSGRITINFTRSDDNTPHHVTFVSAGDLDGDGFNELKVSDGDSAAFGILIGLLRSGGMSPRDHQSGLPTGKADQSGGGGGTGAPADHTILPPREPSSGLPTGLADNPGGGGNGGSDSFFGYGGKVEVTNSQGTSFLTPDTTITVGPGGKPSDAGPSGPDAQAFVTDAEDTTLFDQFEAAAGGTTANLAPIRAKLQRMDRDLKQIEFDWAKYERSQDIGKLIILWSEALKMRPQLDDLDGDIWHVLGVPTSQLKQYDAMVKFMHEHGVPDVDIPPLLDNIRQRIDELELDISPFIKGNQQLLDQLQGLLDQGNPALGLRGDVIDTDNDGVGDATEIAIGTDPLHNNGPDGFIKLENPDDRASFDYPTDKTISFEYDALDSEAQITYNLVLDAGGKESVRRNAHDTERFDIASLVGPNGLFSDVIGPSGVLTLSWHVEAQLPRSLGNLPPIKSVTRTLTISTPTNQVVEVDLAAASPSGRVGVPVAVNGSITDVNNLGDWEILISYDPTLLAFTGGVKKGLFSSSTVFFNDSNGRLTVSGSVPRGSAGITGAGPIFQLMFNPLLPGRSEVAVTQVTLHDATTKPIQGRPGDIAEVGVTASSAGGGQSSTGGQSSSGGLQQPPGPPVTPQSGGDSAALPALGPLMLVSPKNGDSVDYPGDRDVTFEYTELRTKLDVSYTLFMSAGGAVATKRDYVSGDPMPLAALLGKSGPFGKVLGPNGLDIDWHIEASVDTGGAPLKIESETRRLSVKLPTNSTVSVDLSAARGKTRGLSVGDPVFVRGSLSTVSALGQWQITIDYDASVLDFANGRKMGLFAGGNVRIDTQGPGRIVVSGTAVGAGLSGDGDCFELEFTAKGDGTTTIEVNNPQLTDAMGRPINCNAGGGVDVEVNAASTPGGAAGNGKSNYGKP